MGERCRYRADRRGSRHELLLLTHSLGHLAPRQYLSMDVKKVKNGKVVPYSLPSVEPGADPGVQAVSPQVT